jgi:hypothetical protein
MRSHIHDPVFSSLKKEGIRLPFVYIFPYNKQLRYSLSDFNLTFNRSTNVYLNCHILSAFSHSRTIRCKWVAGYRHYEAVNARLL